MNPEIARSMCLIPALAGAAVGCAPSPSGGRTSDAAVTASEAGAEPAVSEPRWTSSASDAEASLVLTAGIDSIVLRVSCVRSPPVMAVDSDSFEPIGSEERLSFGVDGEPFVFVADPLADRARGVRGEGPILTELLDRLLGATELSAVYGAQVEGPVGAPPRDFVSEFVRACRGVADAAPR